MKKLSCLLIICALLLHTGLAWADMEQVGFAIQKAKTFIVKVKAKSEEMKAPADELRQAGIFLERAEATLKNNTSLLGKLRKEAEPEILHYAEMAEISASIALSRLERISQEQENARLEKMIPELESKIKVFKDKETEIQRLTEEVKKPKGSLQVMSSELALMKKERTELADQAARLKLERENLNGKLEALQSENRRLKDDLKAIETQKGSDIVEMRTNLQRTDRQLAFFKALGKMDYLAKLTANGCTFILPRKDLIKVSAKGPILKATETMAQLLKQALMKNGVQESTLDATGVGQGTALFSKGAVEDNRRVEITVTQD
jgi:DNA repair exonuclease SbcCD ATPase subunit